MLSSVSQFTNTKDETTAIMRPGSLSLQRRWLVGFLVEEKRYRSELYDSESKRILLLLKGPSKTEAAEGREEKRKRQRTQVVLQRSLKHMQIVQRAEAKTITFSGNDEQFPH